MIRSAGVLLSLTSLPSPYGIGTMGESAREFVDFLADAGQTYWEILPVGPTGFGNSPYQPLSSFAGNPYLIDLDELVKDGLLKEKDLKGIKWGKDPEHADYGVLYNERYQVLKKACARLPLFHPEEYFAFLEKEKGWLKDYAVFMAIKNDRKGAAWFSWPEELRRHDSEEVKREAVRLYEDVIFWQRLQYLFFRQYDALKKYANDRGILLIGDLPFYMANDSIDVWSHPEQFELDHSFEMTFTSGMPGYGEDDPGQKWGNPLFNWNRMRSEGYDWWIRRTEFQFRLCDVLRIDHFKGYESYYAIPAQDKDARNGHWEKGPGLELFRRMEERLGKKPLILEDLGVLTPEFLQMVKDSGYPGMRILEYAFDPNDPGSIYMPFQYDKNCVVYTGTHDNDTLAGWMKDKNNKPRIERAKKYLNLTREEGYANGILRAAYASPADLAVIPLQDLLGLGSEARMNDPSGSTNPWSWRTLPGSCTEKLAASLKERMLLYCRNNWNVKPKAENDPVIDKN